jgi:hypothetical protein
VYLVGSGPGGAFFPRYVRLYPNNGRGSGRSRESEVDPNRKYTAPSLVA